jgi:predicted RNA-binding Zn-ribbon protein involved in translation (DUF1610 family)
MLWIETKYISLISAQFRNFKRQSKSYNFACPYCGDSSKNKFKARGYLYEKKGTHPYYCHNCGISKSFDKFLNDQTPQLYKEYKLEILKEKGNLKVKKEIDTNTSKVKSSAFPDYMKSGSPLRTLKKISQLDWDHPAKTYVLDRKIPNTYHGKLFYCSKFYEWTNTIIPNKFKVTKDEPRLIIPFIDQNNKFFGYQGRSFNKTSSLRYITIMLEESRPKIFGLDELNTGKTVYVTEGPLDSIFVDNCIAMAGSDGQIQFDDVVMVYDNEPRSIEIVKKIQKSIDKGHKVVVWPSTLDYKDINDMAMGNLNKADIKLLIDTNTYRGLQADMALVNWKKC